MNSATRPSRGWRWNNYITGAVYRKGQRPLLFLCPFSETRPRKGQNMRTENTRKDKLKAYLIANCKGRENAMRGKELKIALNLSGTDLQKLVSALRHDTVPVCSGPDGYFIAKNAAEVCDSMDWLRTMVRGIEADIYGLRASLGGFRKGDE